MTSSTLASADALYSALEQAGEHRKLPPVHSWHPERVGEIDIEIASDGTWFHEGAPFKRQSLINLFATVLRLEDGIYYLVTPHEKLRITVRDVPFVATDFEHRGSGCNTDVLFQTNVGDIVLADDAHRVWFDGKRPYVHVRDGLNALIARAAFYRLADIAQFEDGEVAIYSAGERFVVGNAG